LPVLLLAPLLFGAAPAPDPDKPRACFMLFELGAGQVRRDGDACDERVTPASTFKVPHALFALDAKVITVDEKINFASTTQPMPESWRRAHTLATAMRNSVVWFFQRIAERLGAEREQAYLEKFNYGNKDASSGLTSFWLGGSLKISPAEQQAFLLKLYMDRLPVEIRTAAEVRQMLKQPPNVVVNSLGEHRFAAPWPEGTVVSAKTGSATDDSGRDVRWLIGHVKRDTRAWVFVACVIGGDDLPAGAAIDLAASSLRSAKVL
jgi:beta-lactamase class D